MPFFKVDTEVKSIEHAIDQTQRLVQKENYTMLEKLWERALSPEIWKTAGGTGSRGYEYSVWTCSV